jgi:hypothetical protein
VLGDPGIAKLAQLRTGCYPGYGCVEISPELQLAQLQGRAPDPLAAIARSGGFDPKDFLLDKVLPVASAAVALVGGPGASVAIKAGTALSAQQGGRPMAFSDGDSGFFGNQGFFGGLNQALQGGLGQQLLGIGTQALSGFVGQQFAPRSLQTSMSAVPSVVRGGAVVARGFFNRFPNLAVAMQQLRNQGKKVTRSNLYSLMRRFGPDFLIAGGILTAAAVSELAMAGPGRRRMNPGNVKALRRAHRRMKSFHRICVTNDRMLLGRRRTSKASRFAGGTSVVSVK